MLMKAGELEAVVTEVDAGLHGAIVQKVYSPAAHEVWVELRQKGRSTLVCICARANLERISVADQRPVSPPAASGFQQRLRKHLIGKRLQQVTVHGHVATFSFAAGQLVMDLSAHELRFGPPELFPEREPASATSEFPLARALEGRVEHTVVDDTQLRLERHLKKLRRTREKIAAEAARGALADGMKRDGELLARNLHAVTRGATTVRLTDYLADGGIVERDIALDPKRSPRQQVEWLFHQYKRLQRGMAIATERLQKLDAEIAAAQVPDARPQLRGKQDQSVPSLPYRELKSPSGQRFWVGRGAAHNDTLTFRHAKPHHLWLHARGVPGAHVVVPLEKKQTLEQETLLDAAHLAFHHSDLKGERTGEVSYTHVRHLKKGGAPGAVHYTHETTFWLRFDPERLKRLTE